MTTTRDIETPPNTETRISTGIKGLDFVLNGGLPENHLYLIEGTPGTGKTTIALQFLLEGVRKGESTLIITLSESARELRAVAASHGWSLDNIHLFELNAMNGRTSSGDYTVFYPSEVELTSTTNRIYEQVDQWQPKRVVIDSLSELRLVASDPLRYRRQVLALKQFFAERAITVLMLDDLTAAATDLQLQSICHGVIQLERIPTPYSDTQRRLTVLKMRGVAYQEGFHDFSLARGGVQVHPRLVAARARTTPATHKAHLIQSGLAELDALLGNDLSGGSSVLLVGPAGSGKSTLTTQYLWQAAQRGEPGTAYLFEEGLATYLKRSRGLGLPLEEAIASGLLVLHPIDPAILTPGEFAHRVQQDVEHRQPRIVVIDSLTGYLNAMPSEQYLLIQMHELVTYLNDKNVLSMMVISQQGGLGKTMSTPVDVSYLADSVISLRFFEAGGQVRKALSVLKNRQGIAESTIREIRFGKSGIQVSPPLTQFRGILTGTPEFIGRKDTLTMEVS